MALPQDQTRRVDLVWPADSEGVHEEVVLSVRGYIVEQNLPPVLSEHV